MFAITGITGQVCGEVARNLLALAILFGQWFVRLAKEKPGRTMAATW
jgi:hypothetical protein